MIYDSDNARDDAPLDPISSILNNSASSSRRERRSRSVGDKPVLDVDDLVKSLTADVIGRVGTTERKAA